MWHALGAGKTVEELEIDLEDPDEDEERMLQACLPPRSLHAATAAPKPVFAHLGLARLRELSSLSFVVVAATATCDLPR